ncbi:MAG: phosphate signaling complex protein PhoU [Solirubrobacteraceae bacterium]|nr:phosphate signaling complex protein PhoU [Solirubrobacteraceae bacterium]
MTELRSGFHEQLARLEQLALEGIDLVVEQVDRTTETLRHHDVELAQLVVMADARIDARYLDLHSGVISLLALQAPVASDLRLVTSLLYIARHLERMGDQCVNVAKLVPLSGWEPPSDQRLVEDIVALAEGTRSVVRVAREAFARRDVDLAGSLRELDEDIDARNKAIFREAIDLGGDVDRREWSMTMVMAARAFERIADNAVDIGEHVVFLATGRYRGLDFTSRNEL